MTEIQCDCGKYKARLNGFPENSPGRLVCYCDDCQKFLEKLGRSELLDEYGGTEIIPVYPSEYEVLQGAEYLECNRLTPNGLNRWSTSCCNSPVGNIMAKFPWVGIIHSAYKVNDPQFLEKMGPVRSHVMGKFAKATPNFKISEKMRLRDVIVVFPFLLKGFLSGKYKKSCFFKEDGVTPSKEPKILV